MKAHVSVAPKWTSNLQHPDYIGQELQMSPPEADWCAGGLLGSPFENKTGGRVKGVDWARGEVGLHSPTAKASTDPTGNALTLG